MCKYIEICGICVRSANVYYVCIVCEAREVPGPMWSLLAIRARHGVISQEGFVDVCFVESLLCGGNEHDNQNRNRKGIDIFKYSLPINTKS